MTDEMIRAFEKERERLTAQLRVETDAHQRTLAMHEAEMCGADALLAERDAALAREARLREALDGLMVSATEFREWVRKNPEAAADPCAEDYNLSCALSAAWDALPGAALASEAPT